MDKKDSGHLGSGQWDSGHLGSDQCDSVTLNYEHLPYTYS